MGMKRVGGTAMLVLGLGGVVGCVEGDPARPEPEIVLLDVTPKGGGRGVDPASAIVITFDQPIMASMVGYAALHEGTVTGPVVPGVWSLSDDGRVLTFEHGQPLKPATSYTIHLGGGLRGAHGERVDYETHGGVHMGGQWVSSSMMNGGATGMGGRHPHSEEGWSHPNGTWGMVFRFTTGG